MSGFRDLGPGDQFYVYDKRSGVKIWEGYTSAPEGDWEVTAMGGTILASDDTPPLIYVDPDFTGWERADGDGEPA